MRKPKKALVNEAIDKQLAIVTFAFDLNHVADDARTAGTILKLGMVEGQNVLPGRTVLLMWDAFVCGQKKTLTPVEQMLMDMLDGCKGPHEIHEQTGMSMERCEEIYNWYRDFPEDWKRQ